MVAAPVGRLGRPTTCAGVHNVARLSGAVSHRAHGAVRSLEDCWPHARIAGNTLRVAASARAVRVHFDEFHPGFGQEKPWTPSTTRVPSSLRKLGLSDARMTRTSAHRRCSPHPTNRFMRCERMRLDQSALYERQRNVASPVRKSRRHSRSETKSPGHCSSQPKHMVGVGRQ